MAQFFVMPQASPTMTVGVVAKWLAPEGSALTSSQAIAAVETDKATMDIEVFDKGVMLKHLAKEGQEVPPGQPIAIIGLRADEDISALVAEYAAMSAAPVAPAAAAPAAPSPAPVAAAAPAPAAAPTPAPAPRPAGEPGKSAAIEWNGAAVDDSFMEARAPFRPPAPRVLASPLARQIASETGVALSRVRGSGPNGRIVAADVEAASVRGPTGAVRPPDNPVRATQMRKTIARRLTDVHQQVPVFYLTTSFNATAIVALKDLVARRAGKDGAKVSVNDILLRCIAQALREVPAVNAQWTGESIVQKGGVDIGVAVALPEGLITPVIRDADQKSVATIGAEVRALAARAKEGKLAPEEYTGGTFTVSNLGMFEIEHFTAILNPPEAAILAVGSAAQVPHVENGAVVAQWRMQVTMTCDHRVIDGALGARFLQALRQYVENPGLFAIG